MRQGDTQQHRATPTWLYQDASERWGVIEGDTLDVLPRLPDACVDAVVTDPPYGIGFRGETWDGAGVFATSGDQGVAFSRWTRSWAAEVRRVLKPGGHLVAFGAPRTFHRLAVGVEDAGLEVRDVLLWLNGQGVPKSRRYPGGMASALKPAYEPILLARAPLAGTLVTNNAAWGTGLLGVRETAVRSAVAARWPANVVLSHASSCTSQECAAVCPVALLDAPAPGVRPSRFFYAAKAIRHERDAGCEQLPTHRAQIFGGENNASRRRNIHPTVKPLDLMRWLIRLSCPVGGIVLDAFAGSGSTGAAAMLEDRQFLGLEREGAYVDIACARISHWTHATDEHDG